MREEINPNEPNRRAQSFGSKIENPLYEEFFNVVEVLVNNSGKEELDLGDLNVRYEKNGEYDLSNCSLELKGTDTNCSDNESYELGLHIKKNSFKDIEVEEVYNDCENTGIIEEKMQEVLDNYDQIKQEHVSDLQAGKYPL